MKSGEGIKPGDVVILKSGGPKMTVAEVDCHAATDQNGVVIDKVASKYLCYWFTKEQVYRDVWFPGETVAPYVEPPKAVKKV